MSFRRSSYLLVFLFCVCCRHPHSSFPSRLDALFEKRDTAKPFIVNVLNPYECYACVALTKEYLKIYTEQPGIAVQNIVFVTLKIREIELEKFLSESGLSQKNYAVIADDDLANELRTHIRQEFFASFALFYGNDKSLLLSMEITNRDIKNSVLSYFPAP